MSLVVKQTKKVIKTNKTISISPNNSKLGNIASFSLPSITTCPGATSECKKVCYAAKVERIYKNAAKSYELNFNYIENPNFVFDLSSEITKLSTKKKNPISVFRWHVSGDIVKIKYLYDIIKVVSAFPNIEFYAYTRNWRLSSWISHLENLKALSNMTVFASIDDDTIKANEWPSQTWKVAYFGDNLNIVKTKYNMLQCPEQLVGKTCEKCGLCFKTSNKENKKINIVFKKH